MKRYEHKKMEGVNKVMQGLFKNEDDTTFWDVDMAEGIDVGIPIYWNHTWMSSAEISMSEQEFQT